MHGYKWPINCTRTRSSVTDGGGYVKAYQQRGHRAVVRPLSFDRALPEPAQLLVLVDLGVGKHGERFLPLRLAFRVARAVVLADARAYLLQVRLLLQFHAGAAAVHNPRRRQRRSCCRLAGSRVGQRGRACVPFEPP